MNQAAAIMCKKYSPRNERPVIIYSPEYHSFFLFSDFDWNDWIFICGWM